MAETSFRVTRFEEQHLKYHRITITTITAIIDVTTYRARIVFA